jgi:hypothetical protein
MNLELTDEQAELLAREFRDLIDADRYFQSPRVQILREILSARPTLPISRDGI